jgi:hypothetical protein
MAVPTIQVDARNNSYIVELRDGQLVSTIGKYRTEGEAVEVVRDLLSRIAPACMSVRSPIN